MPNSDSPFITLDPAVKQRDDGTKHLCNNAPSFYTVLGSAAFGAITGGFTGFVAGGPAGMVAGAIYGAYMGAAGAVIREAGHGLEELYPVLGPVFVPESPPEPVQTITIYNKWF